MVKYNRMKRKADILRATWVLGSWAAVLLAVLGLGACADDRFPAPENPETTGQALVTLTVNTPKPSLQTAATRAQTEEESRISAVRVLVFDAGDSGNTYKYMVSGNDISPAGTNQSKFKVTLAASEHPLKLVIIANAEGAFGAFDPVIGTPESTVREQLNASLTAAGLTGDLPMYAETLLPDGVSPSEAYSLSVTALRAIARVDVEKDLVADAPEFTLEEVYVFRANDMIQLIPDALAGGSAPKVEAPSVPEGAGALALPLVKTAAGGAESIIQLYIPESAEAVTNAEKLTGATTVVIGGRFGGGDNAVTYYRADFDSGLAGHPFGQVLRNYRYIFRIKRVSSDGWERPEQAADNMAASMLVSVEAWEDFASEMYYGDDKLAVSSRSISLRYTADRTRRLDVESTQTYEIQWLDPSTGEPVGDATSTPDTPVADDVFEAQIVQDAGDEADVTHIAFRTLTDNTQGDAPIVRMMRITAGRWKVDITVSQDNSALYSDRIVRILSANELGHLGENLVLSGASGMAMRKVLDAQFAPTGVVRIGGSSFTLIPNTAGYLGTVLPENLAVLTRIFGAQDVVYLPYNLLSTQSTANLIYNWLQQSDNRVLVLGFDNAAGMEELRPMLVDENTSFGFSPALFSTNFVRSPASPGSEDFFNGPFGAVAEGSAYPRVDVTAGYMVGYGSDVIPLISGDKNAAAAFMSVNKGRRVVFLGDGNLFQQPRMSSGANSSGTVNTDLDRLMANTWAWIVEQVIYGNE